ncbi:hypothetical protein Lalb_Chr15g0079911 [Lupinus albus]|uniref:Uncharacterized protein n=1 Tax=Lupinus albus TaxID=3870 RepID=A0A6A4PE91_LUPAL|nr:hypothetical protein Lalb_Chr15g0079911 [Lupinus albus]
MHPRQPRGGFYASGRDGNFERINSVTKSYYPHKGGFNDGDVFVEAGRLAAEYLVSQGMLPPNVLSLRLNDNCNVVGGVVGFRGNGFDWGHDFRRNEYWNDRYRGGVDFKDDSGGGGDDDGVTRERDEEEEQQQEDGVGTGGGGDGGDGGDDALQKLDSNEIVPKSEDGDDLDAEIEKVDCVSGELESEQKSSGAEKDTYNMEMEFGESSIVLENASGEVKEVQERDVARADDDDNMEKSSISKNLSVQSNNQENMSPSRVFTDLISLCKSVKVPTRIRSSRTKKNLKADHHHDDDKDMGSIQGPDVIVENESVKGPSSGDLLSEKTYDLEHTDSDIVKVEPVQDVKNTKEFDTLCNAEEVQPIGFQSREDGGFMHDNSQKSSAVPEYGSCSTMAEERGEKRAAEAGDIREETKRLREWLPVLVPRTGEYFVNSNRIEIKESLGEDEISLIDKVTSSDQESLMSSQFTLGGDKPSLKCSEGKQSLPSSFRTCDLNLIEASEVHENHVDHPTLIYPPGTKAKKDVPVDISLPMSHTSVSGKFSTHSTSGKEIEVIDLENDSAEEEKPVENMERKTDTMFQGLEGFTNHAQNTGDINDVQDGYGLMISELLATDFPNCSSVPSDINSVHNEIDLHNVPEPLIGEDDSIYMSLGEIPLSFLRSWEQPPSQDYQKPF